MSDRREDQATVVDQDGGDGTKVSFVASEALDRSTVSARTVRLTAGATS